MEAANSESNFRTMTGQKNAARSCASRRCRDCTVEFSLDPLDVQLAIVWHGSCQRKITSISSCKESTLPCDLVPSHVHLLFPTHPVHEPTNLCYVELIRP